MNQQQFIALYEKFLLGQCTPEEEETLKLHSENFLTDDVWKSEMGEQDEVKMAILNQIQQTIAPPKVIPFRLYKWIAAASVILVLSIASWYIFKLSPSVKNIPLNAQVNFKNDILPGSNKAVLTLSSGIKIILNNTKNGLITNQGSAKIAKLNDGQILYSQSGVQSNKLVYNNMATPRGGNYNLTLADGTKVFLNSESSITYPASFSGNSREVSITGEVYFEVAKNPLMPFIVNAKGTKTKVLGTHFNIMAYQDEQVIKTTLFEGSVKFSKNNSDVLLKPGQQAVSADANNTITVQDADLEETLAWKNGYFLFQDEDIRSIMRKAARWYNIDVVYEDNVKNISFGGLVSRSKNISDLLKLLQSTGTVKFKIDGRRIRVMK